MQSECEVEPMLRLWRSVLAQSVQDALAPDGEMRAGVGHLSALRWFGSRDFRMICEMAGVCPDRMMTRLAPRLALARVGSFAEAARGLVSDEKMALRRVG